MTNVYITIDTEYSSGLVSDLSDQDRRDNFARSLACETPDGPGGITQKLEVFERYGIKAVFFVDPMPALVWGLAAIEDILAPIIEAGQDIQLHCHTEWIRIAGDASPLKVKRAGKNLFEFTFDEQCEILDFARETLMAAGAPSPLAFRAGNYGADDNTLRALAQLGLRYDSSHCPALPVGASRISLGPDTRDPVAYQGIIEVPVGSIGTLGGGQRHAQITALSLNEMRAAIEHARDQRRESFTLVTHSFELINRRKQQMNHIVRRRFEGLCKALSTMEAVRTANYRDDPPVVAVQSNPSEPLPASPLRTGYRYAEQLVSNTLYGAL
ncbi:MAG: hypothetical protein AAF697_13185 [Pseudomonadota bacterium]